MNILIVSPWLPYPPSWGFGKRVYHLLEVLSRVHRVTLVTYSDGTDSNDVNALRSRCDAVHTVSPPPFPFGKRLAQLRSLASPASFQRRTMYSIAMQKKLDELTSGAPFDVIQVETSQLACFRYDRRSIVVLDEHNIEYELYYRMYQAESSLPRRVFNGVEYRKFRRAEISSWKTMTGCVLTSRREEATVNVLSPATPTVVVPNAVDTELFEPGTDAVDPDAIVLTGLMKYRPNVDAAIHFVRDIFPRIRAERPAAVFYIVGGEPPPEVRRLASENVVVTGSVDDVRPYVRRAAVFVVPLRMGSGTRLKVLEGLSMGKAMVSTSLGCEGIELTHGEHLLIADGADTFADAVLSLMTRHDVADRLGRQGRELMLKQYRWETAATELVSFYDRLLAEDTTRMPRA